MSDLVANLYFVSLPFTLLVCSGVVMAATGVILRALYLYMELLQEETREQEKAELEREQEDEEIGTLSGNMLVLMFLLPFALLLAAIFAVATIVFGVVLVRYLAIGALLIIETGSPFVALLFITVALLLYGMRTRYPFLYGMVEVIVGIAAIFSVLPTQPPIETLVVYAELLSVSGGMYVIVRGLDNMNKAVPGFMKRYWLVLRWGVPQ